MKLELTDCTNVGVFAPVCSGKTFLMNQWLSQQNRFLRFDYTGETMNDSSVEHFHSPRELLLRLRDEDLGGGYFFRIAYHPGREVMEHYRWCQRALWTLDTPRWFALDECHRIFGQRNAMDADAEYLIRLARHNQIGVIGMTQRPQDVQKLFVDSCRMCVIFRSQEENFLNACAGHWGNEVADVVENLRPLIYLDKTKEVKQIQQCVVVTRDGQQPRIYDFKTDRFIPMDVFLSGDHNGQPEQEEETEQEVPEGEGEENGDGAFHRDSRSSGASNGELPDIADDSDFTEL
jgi:hypothetical protein